MKCLVTGGAGFIGSHLIDSLMDIGHEVVAVDDLSSGSLGNLRKWMGAKGFNFVALDISRAGRLEKLLPGCEVVFHLAANPEVRVSSVEPSIHFNRNVLATFNVLECVRRSKDVRALVFTSSSTVYGEASRIPTPEDYSPLEPISVYGASKLACEALVTSYAHSYGFNAVILRLANVVGPRSRHGVVYDFIRKLTSNPMKLEILGDGTQSKSYLYVSDCISAMLSALRGASKRVEVFNVGSEDQVDVSTIARIVVEEMGLKDVEFVLTGGVDGGRGWVGDVKRMLLDISKIKSVGWRPKHTSAEAVRLAVRALLQELER